ncbi:hypothetical protein ABIB00_005460 [Bradyrhizobium sp. LB14.3]
MSKNVQLPAKARTKIASGPDRVNLVGRISKLRFSSARKPPGGELLQIVRKQMHGQSRALYIDRHRPETLVAAMVKNSPVTSRGDRRPPYLTGGR